MELRHTTSTSATSTITESHNHSHNHGHGHGHSRASSVRLTRFNCFNKIVESLPNIIDQGMVYAGPVLVVLAWVLVAMVVYIYFFHVMAIRKLDSWSFPGCPQTLFGYFILFNIVYNHVMAIFTSPGTIPDYVSVPTNIEQLIQEERYRDRTQFTKYCRSCRKPKPPRAHHCHICKKCVLKMDHHCPWVANCVGHGNYKYFLLFLFYLFIGCAYIVVVTLPAFFTKTDRPLRIEHEGPALFALVLCASAFFAIALMLCLHSYLVSTNQSTIELYYNRKQSKVAKSRGEIFFNLYDMGTKKNFESVFGVGRYWFSWLLPGKPPGDGLAFAMRPGFDDSDLEANIRPLSRDNDLTVGSVLNL